MRRLIYTSRSLIDPSDITALVERSAQRNSRVGLTGMLWTGAGCFAQVLEGEGGSLSATMERIRHNDRHTDIVVLLDSDTVSRQFGNWSMRSADDEEATAFVLGFALSQQTEAGEHLRQIVLISIE